MVIEQELEEELEEVEEMKKEGLDGGNQFKRHAERNHAVCAEDVVRKDVGERGRL